MANDPIWLLRHCSHLELDEYWQGDDNAQTAALPFDGVACTIDPGEDDVLTQALLGGALISTTEHSHPQ